MSDPGQRDAIHVATIVLSCHENLNPGERVGVAGTSTADGTLGIVNPFGPKRCKGELCTVWLCPKTTGPVRHVWEHPAIDQPVEEEVEVEQYDWDEYVTRIARTLGVSDIDLLYACEYVVEHGTESGGSQADWNQDVEVDWDQFWSRYNTRFGTNVTRSDDPFCC